MINYGRYINAISRDIYYLFDEAYLLASESDRFENADRFARFHKIKLDRNYSMPINGFYGVSTLTECSLLYEIIIYSLHRSSACNAVVCRN